MPFKSGTSGNPSGRPKGSGYRQQIFNDLVLPHRDALLKKGISMAMEGDTQMLKLFLERLLPAKPVDEPVALKLPEEVTLEAAMTMGKDILKLLNNEEITPDQAKNLFGIVKFYQEGVAAYDLLNSFKKLRDQLQEKDKFNEINILQTK